MKRALITLCLLGSPVLACDDLTVLSCTVENGRQFELCASATGLTYRYGPPGAPEIVLSNPLDASGHTPWPGIGRTIWESVSFRNAGYTYEVFSGFERDYGNPDEEIEVTHFAGVLVSQGDTVVTEIRCKADSIRNGQADILYQHMTDHGYCWSHEKFEWIICE